MVGWQVRKEECFSCCLWRCLTLKAKISASSNVTVRACDFTTYSLFMSHANGPERDRVKYWDNRRNRTPSSVFSCYESLESTTLHTTACQWIKSRASCTHFQPSTNFSSIHPSVKQRRLLCLAINCLLRCYSTKILYVSILPTKFVSGCSVNEDEWATQNFWMGPIYNFRYSSTSR